MIFVLLCGSDWQTVKHIKSKCRFGGIPSIVCPIHKTLKKWFKNLNLPESVTDRQAGGDGGCRNGNRIYSLGNQRYYHHVTTPLSCIGASLNFAAVAAQHSRPTDVLGTRRRATRRFVFNNILECLSWASSPYERDDCGNSMTGLGDF